MCSHNNVRRIFFLCCFNACRSQQIILPVAPLIFIPSSYHVEESSHIVDAFLTIACSFAVVSCFYGSFPWQCTAGDEGEEVPDLSATHNKLPSTRSSSCDEHIITLFPTRRIEPNRGTVIGRKGSPI